MYTFLTLDVPRAFYVLWVAVRFGARPMARHFLGLYVDRVDAGKRLRLGLETLGLTYVKLGQYLAARLDLLPEEVCRELRNLFERAKPVSFDQIRDVVERELQPLPEIFGYFSREPIAAASVAQVHEAYTLAGDHVAVKAQRPKVALLFGADIRNLRRLAVVADALGALGTVSVSAVLAEFEKWTSRELDFAEEGRTAERLRREATAAGAVPGIYWRLTAPRVLTMEFVEGISLARIFELRESGRTREIEERYPRLDLHVVAENLVEIVMNQFFVTGFFHGDPHPGNIFVRPDNTIVLLDCGIFGELSDQQREYLAAHIEHLALGDIDTAFYYYTRQLVFTEETDAAEFERQGKALLRTWLRSASSRHSRYEDRQIGRYGGEMLKLVKQHHVRITTETLLFWRAMEALDATVIRFRSHIDFLEAMRAFFERIRPSPAERLVGILTNREIWRRTAQLAGATPDAGRQAISGLTGSRSAMLSGSEAPFTRHSETRQAKWITLTVFSVSAAILGIGSSGDVLPFASRAAAGAAVLMLAGMIRELFRGNRP